MEISELKPGTKLELELFGEYGGKIEHNLVSEFEWQVDGNTLMIAAPIHEGTIYPIRAGSGMNLFFVKKNEMEYELYSFKAYMISREINENIALLKVAASSGIEKVQRRKYYRLGCSIPVRYRVVDTMNQIANENIPFRKTIASNISGGGICLLLEEKLEVGRLVECEVSTEENKTIKFYGKVIRYEKSELESRFRFEAGIVYIKINNNDREMVVKYIFSEQRKLRKKGLL